MKIAILSDIHGNLEAFSRVLEKLHRIQELDGVVLLGDNIDYCPHSNEVVSLIRTQLNEKIICSIWGNHEMMIFRNDFSTFDLGRGVRCAIHTRDSLTDDTADYLKRNASSDAMKSFEVDGKKCLAVHGSIDDPYWGTIEQGQDYSHYGEYDFVFSGHSHIPHFFEIYYPADDADRRNKKKTVFINPGSVGQPRNHSPLSQFAILDIDTEELLFQKVKYDIVKEQAAFSSEVDDFYRRRLTFGV